MAENPSIAAIKARLGDDGISTATVDIYLQDAHDAILHRLYPFGVPPDTEFPEEYETLACKLTVRYISRRGAEGEDTHNENGINRGYSTVDDDDLLCVVTPFAKVT